MVAKKRGRFADALTNEEKPVTPGDPSSMPSQVDRANTDRAKGSSAKTEKGKHIGGYYSEEALTQIRLLAAERQTTQRELVREALNDLLTKYGKPPIV